MRDARDLGTVSIKLLHLKDFVRTTCRRGKLTGDGFAPERAKRRRKFGGRAHLLGCEKREACSSQVVDGCGARREFRRIFDWRERQTPNPRHVGHKTDIDAGGKSLKKVFEPCVFLCTRHLDVRRRGELSVGCERRAAPRMSFNTNCVPMIVARAYENETIGISDETSQTQVSSRTQVWCRRTKAGARTAPAREALAFGSVGVGISCLLNDRETRCGRGEEDSRAG